MSIYNYACSCGKETDILTDGFETRKETRKRTGGVFCECGKEMLRNIPNFTLCFNPWVHQSKVEFENSTMEESMSSFNE